MHSDRADESSPKGSCVGRTRLVSDSSPNQAPTIELIDISYLPMETDGILKFAF